MRNPRPTRWGLSPELTRMAAPFARGSTNKGTDSNISMLLIHGTRAALLTAVEERGLTRNRINPDIRRNLRLRFALNFE
jgi:hypothetical protein